MSMRLPVLCPQEYDGLDMKVTTCTRCDVGWDRTSRRCTVTTGCEHLPVEDEVSTCPIQDRCQHQVQDVAPCVVRSRGLVCESALREAGVPDPESHHGLYRLRRMESER